MEKCNCLTVKEVKEMVKNGEYGKAYSAIVCGAKVDADLDEEIRMKVEGITVISGILVALGA